MGRTQHLVGILRRIWDHGALQGVVYVVSVAAAILAIAGVEELTSAPAPGQSASVCIIFVHVDPGGQTGTAAWRLLPESECHRPIVMGG